MFLYWFFFDNQKEDRKFFNKLPGFGEKCALTRGLKEVDVSYPSHLFRQTNEQGMMQSWSTGQVGIWVLISSWSLYFSMTKAPEEAQAFHSEFPLGPMEDIPKTALFTILNIKF